MKIDSFELRSPAELIEEVADRVPLVDGTAYAVLVHDPSRIQQVRAVAALPFGNLIDDDNYDEVRHYLEELCAGWGGGRSRLPSDFKVVTVVVRRGLCVWTSLEWAWSNAWRYASTGLSTGDLITVTEHGWYDFMTKHADHLPALVEV
jgi:hypothetical protein